LSKLRVSLEMAHVFAGPSVLVFGNQNMVTLQFMVLKGAVAVSFKMQLPLC